MEIIVSYLTWVLGTSNAEPSLCPPADLVLSTWWTLRILGVTYFQLHSAIREKEGRDSPNQASGLLDLKEIGCLYLFVLLNKTNKLRKVGSVDQGLLNLSLGRCWSQILKHWGVVWQVWGTGYGTKGLEHARHKFCHWATVQTFSNVKLLQ